MSDGNPTFTGQQAAIAQTALRNVLGLGTEQFPIPAFIGMISDEIEQLRAHGKTDDQVAELIEQAIGVKLTAETITRFYATPQERGHYGE